MALTVFNLKKWMKMLLGKSVAHVNQNMGPFFCPGEIKGYFNNLTEKVLMRPELLDGNRLPTIIHEDGTVVEFPVEIFQYGLGAYDLYIATKKKVYYEKFEQCVKWAMDHINSDGAWDTFSYIYRDNPFGAMCQGEGVSLLVRAYKETGEGAYYELAQKALDFMLKSVKEGGTSERNNNEIIFLEYTHLKVVLNGWIFALFGLYDYTIVDDNVYYKDLLNKSIRTIASYLPKFDNGFWSFYDLDNKMASPFYHKLHIAQLEALSLISKDPIFKDYFYQWSNYLSDPYGRIKAFLIKSYQKIRE